MKAVYKIKCVNCGRVEKVAIEDIYSWRCYCGSTSWEFADEKPEHINTFNKDKPTDPNDSLHN